MPRRAPRAAPGPGRKQRERGGVDKSLMGVPTERQAWAWLVWVIWVVLEHSMVWDLAGVGWAGASGHVGRVGGAASGRVGLGGKDTPPPRWSPPPSLRVGQPWEGSLSGSAMLQTPKRQKHKVTQGRSEQDLRPGSARFRALALSRSAARFPLCSNTLANATRRELRASYCKTSL